MLFRSVLRRIQPQLKRGFRMPGIPLVPILSILGALFLMGNLPLETWIRFVIWLLIGFVIYYFYSRRKSALA